MKTAAALRNGTGTKYHNRKTPEKMLTARKPLVGNFRTFGCEAWVLVSQRKKWDPKARRDIVLRSLSRVNYRV